MSLFRTLDRTTCHSVSNTASSSLFVFLCPAIQKKVDRRDYSRSAVRRAPRMPTPPVKQMDNFFIQALAQAGTCHEHQRRISTLQNGHGAARKHDKVQRHPKVSREREYHQSPKKEGPFKSLKQFATKELEALVDYYHIDFETGPELDENIEDDGSLIWNVGDDHVAWPVKEDIHKTYIAIIKKLLKDERSSHEEIYSYYKQLPSPGVVYLDHTTIHDLLHHLSLVERPDQLSMLRFLSIADDMKDAHIHLKLSEWTSAIHLAGRCMGRPSSAEIESALHIWKDMEKRAGVSGGPVTFNVLFDMAVKAGKFALAETYLKAMQRRNVALHRHFRVSLLYYYGVMQNGHAVRKTYQELVAAGEVVDTVVLNAVMAALLRAGEPSAAEHVFERMKRLHAKKTIPVLPPRNWRERRQLGVKLAKMGRQLGRGNSITDRDKVEETQSDAPIAPDSRTYGLFIRHHAYTTGNIDRIEDLLQEMSQNKIGIDGTIFVVMMYGFSSFGGVRYSSWTRDKLEKLWNEYLECVRAGADRTWLSPFAVKTALKAFKRCTDDERTLRVWEEARELWHPSPHDLELVLKDIRRIIPNSSFFNENM